MRIQTVGDLKQALAKYPDELRLITCDDSMGTFDAAGVVLRQVRYSADFDGVVFTDDPDPDGSGPERGECVGSDEVDEDAGAIDGLYIYPDAED